MAKAAGGKLTAKEIERCTPGCYHRSDIEKMLNGEFKASSYDNGAGLYPRVDGFQDFCREKGLSADQLLGLAPAPQPEGQMVISGWMPGGTTPAEPGRFAALMDLGKKTYFRQFLRWDGTAWLFDNKSAMPLEMEPSWWMRLPDDPEKPNE